MRKVLIVEDDDAMAVALHDGFKYEDYEVVMARDGATGLSLASQESPDLIILDWMLPKLDGVGVLTTLRDEGNETPVLMLTARDAVQDRVADFRICGKWYSKAGLLDYRFDE